MKISRELKAAFIVISSLLLLIWGLSYLKGDDLLSKNKTLFFHLDNVEGLSSASTVTYMGLQIGKVKSVKYDNQKKANIVEIIVDSKIPISKTSVASVYESSPIGGKNVAIFHDDTNTELTVNKDFLSSEIKLGMLSEFTNSLKPIEGKASDLLDNSNKMIININDILDEETKRNLRNSVKSLNASLNDLTTTTQLINNILKDNKDNINKTTANLTNITNDFAKISNDLTEANFKETVNNLESTLNNFNQLLEDMQKGKGSLGKLMKDEALYNNLEGVSRELEALLSDFKTNPKRYVHFSVFGKKNEQYVPKDTIIIKMN